MNSIYRKFKDPDISSLVDLMAQLGYEHSTKSLLKNLDAVRGAGGEVFVCEISGMVCGCVSAILDARLAAGLNGEITTLVVDKDHRGQGLGRGLVGHAETWLEQRVPSIRIRANTIRQDAHRFYESLGYSLSKTQAVFKKSLER